MNSLVKGIVGTSFTSSGMQGAPGYAGRVEKSYALGMVRSRLPERQERQRKAAASEARLKMEVAVACLLTARGVVSERID
jgi:hypothetical protein